MYFVIRVLWFLLYLNVYCHMCFIVYIMCICTFVKSAPWFMLCVYVLLSNQFHGLCYVYMHFCQISSMVYVMCICTFVICVSWFIVCVYVYCHMCFIVSKVCVSTFVKCV